MLFSAAVSVLALLIDSTTASPTPVQKRYTGVTIRSYRTNTCLTLQGGVQIQNGSPLKVGDCSSATRWDINPGSGSVIVSGTNFALDAGTDPHNNVPAKVWQSYPGLTQQTWYLTDDNRIAITGGNQCLDEGDNGPQTYQCTTGNTNQIWYVDGRGPPPSSSSSMPSSSPTGPPGPRTQIKWKGNTNLCATVQGTAGNGTPVNLANCLNPTSPDAKNQLFYAFSNGVIQLAGTNFCLDAGEDPHNGVQMKVWQCYPGLSQQTWNFPGSLLQTANNQCLDLDNSGYTKLQTWYCSNPDPQQQFTLS